MNKAVKSLRRLSLLLFLFTLAILATTTMVLRPPQGNNFTEAELAATFAAIRIQSTSSAVTPPNDATREYYEDQLEELQVLAATIAAAESQRTEEIRRSEVQLSFVNTSVIVVNLVSLATFVVTTIYRIWEERRTRTTHELTLAKTQLEIEKLRQEVEDKKNSNRKRSTK